MKIYNSILDVIGETPLVRLNYVAEEIEAAIYAKLELLNPGGSVKDRIGLAMIDAAEREGRLKPGGTIVEPTSGNTGVGLAMVAAQRGYKLIFTIPDKMSQEKISLVEAFGAKTIICPTAISQEDPRQYIRVAERITRETPGAFMPNQYSNAANPKAHYLTTGPEIWRQTDGKVDVFVAGIGTGGTITGTARYLKEQKKSVRIVGVDPEGSLYTSKFHHEPEDVHPYKVEGIGEDFIPSTVDLNLVDDIVQVSDKEAFLMARRIAREEGILVGGSSGAAAVGALKAAEGMSKDAVIVTLFPDRGDRYLGKIYSDSWMRSNGYLD